MILSKNICLLIFLVVMTTSCSNYEKIGDFKYKTEVVRVNVGDWDEMIKTIKIYKNPINNTEQLNFAMSGKRLHFERKKDPFLVKGEMAFYKQNGKNIIKTKENVFRYITDTDSIVRLYEQDTVGNIKMISVKTYANGLLESEYIPD